MKPQESTESALALARLEISVAYENETLTTDQEIALVTAWMNAHAINTIAYEIKQLRNTLAIELGWR